MKINYPNPKNERLSQNVAQELSKIIGNKEEFYELLNNKVTPEYKVPDFQAHQDQQEQQNRNIMAKKQAQETYDEHIRRKQAEIVNRRLRIGED